MLNDFQDFPLSSVWLISFTMAWIKILRGLNFFPLRPRTRRNLINLTYSRSTTANFLLAPAPHPQALKLHPPRPLSQRVPPRTRNVSAP